MKTFKDADNRSWDVRIDVNAIRSVRSMLDVNLLSLPENDFELLGKLTTDFVLLVDVIYCICKKQADEKGVSDEEFGRAMRGDVLVEASRGLIDEIIDFFPDSRRRKMLAKIIEKGTALGEILLDRGTEKVKELDDIDLNSEASKLIGSSSSAQGS